MDHSAPGSSVRGIICVNTGVGCSSLLQALRENRFKVDITHSFTNHRTSHLHPIKPPTSHSPSPIEMAFIPEF